MWELFPEIDDEDWRVNDEGFKTEMF